MNDRSVPKTGIPRGSGASCTIVSVAVTATVAKFLSRDFSTIDSFDRFAPSMDFEISERSSILGVCVAPTKRFLIEISEMTSSECESFNGTVKGALLFFLWVSYLITRVQFDDNTWRTIQSDDLSIFSMIIAFNADPRIKSDTAIDYLILSR
ncbi:unnamed protein product, partial [Heterotrigona itama]